MAVSLLAPEPPRGGGHAALHGGSQVPRNRRDARHQPQFRCDSAPPGNRKTSCSDGPAIEAGAIGRGGKAIPQPHCDDQDLLDLKFGDRGWWVRFRVRRHLDICSECRTRLASIEAAGNLWTNTY